MYLGVHDGNTYRNELWVKDYCKKIEELLIDKNPRSISVLGPMPPCDLGPVIEGYPRRGSISQRIEATKWLNGALKFQVTTRKPEWNFINLMNLLATPEGTLSPQKTDDGLHVNSRGAIAIQRFIKNI
jgi:hypothetical protein